MNRGTVILLALAILLAHTLAIHQTPDGDFAPPYEIAHVAYRLGRNLVYEGEALWNPGGPPVESYPSTSWVLASAIAARLYVSPIVVTQSLGLIAALLTVIVLAQFSPKRTSGLIAPLLLAASGSAAAAALSGTEAALAMLLATTAFLAFERGWGRTLAVVLALLLLTRPEGAIVLLALLVFERFLRPRGEHAVRPPRWKAFVLPSLVVLATLILRRTITGYWLSPFAAPLFESDPQRWRVGALYLGSFVTCSGFGLLCLAVILSVCAGRSSAMGTRALMLVGLWWAVVGVSGGDSLPFWNALVPVLPLFFLGVQECLRVWMDEREALARVAWPLLLVSVIAAMLVSKVPGDLGPLRLEEPLERWLTPRGELARAFPRPLGRLGLLEEVRAVEQLRSLGVFLRHRVIADSVVLTAWPGAIGYLSRMRVLDLSGQAWPLTEGGRPNSWRGPARVDVVSSLSRDVDYIVPLVGRLSLSDAPGDFLKGLLERYDTVGHSEARTRELIKALSGFMGVSVPVPAESSAPDEPAVTPFLLLQRKDLERTVLSLEMEGDRVRVLARHDGDEQVVDLCVRAARGDGQELFLSPTGSWESSRIDARTSLLIFRTGMRSIQLIEARVPPALRGAKLSAWLHNPGMRPDGPLSPVGSPVWGEL